MTFESRSARISGWLWLEKKQGAGEDAEPIASKIGDDGYLLGVFDGLGGAGSATYDVGGSSQTGAYLAARLAREGTMATVKAFDAVTKRDLRGESPRVETQSFSAYLDRRVRRTFASSRRHLPEVPTKLRSSLLRVLPTTLVAVYSEASHPPKEVRQVEVVWAGDSRAYRMSPKSGLQQLTTDDIVGDGDPLTNLSSDAPLSNMVTGTGDYELNVRRFGSSEPFLIVAATDGCFGYVPTPWHFEALLLDSLRDPDAEVDWMDCVLRRIARVTSDDASLAFVAFGWRNLPSMARAFAERSRVLQARFRDPFDELSDRLGRAEHQAALAVEFCEMLRKEREDVTRDLWTQYQGDYMVGHAQSDREVERLG